MYHLHVMGVPVDSQSSVIGSIKNIPALCTLVYEGTELDPEDEQPGYTGPLLKAPDGFYHLWVCRPSEPLTLVEGRYLLGSRLLTRRDPSMSGKPYVEERARKEFQRLLARSERTLHVYQEKGTGDQRYLLLWPTETPPAYHDKTENYPYLGKANLETGEVE